MRAGRRGAGGRAACPGAVAVPHDDDVSQYAAPATRVSLIDRLKYVPLGSSADRYLSFGADLRERVEVNSNALLGYRDKTVNIYDLHRVLVFADLQ